MSSETDRAEIIVKHDLLDVHHQAVFVPFGSSEATIGWEFPGNVGLGGWGAAWDTGNHNSSVDYKLENRGHICKEKQIHFVRKNIFLSSILAI